MPEAQPRETEDSTLEGVLVGERSCVAARRGSLVPLSRSVIITVVDAIDGIQSVGGVAYGASKGADRVLMRAFGDDTRARRQTHRRLNADNRIPLGRIDDAPVRLRSQSERAEIDRDGDGASRRASTRVDGEVVRAAGLTTTSGVSLGVVIAAHIRPFAKGSLAHQQRTGIPELLNNERVARDDGANERPTSCSGLHLVFRPNVVFDKEGDTMEGPPHLPIGALLVKHVGDVVHVWIELENGAVDVLVSPDSDGSQSTIKRPWRSQPAIRKEGPTLCIGPPDNAEPRSIRAVSSTKASRYRGKFEAHLSWLLRCLPRGISA